MGEGPVRRTSCSLGWWCRGATKKGEVLHVLKSRRLTSLIDVRLLPPSTIKAQRRHQSHDLLDSRHLSLWCGVIKGSHGFGGGLLAIYEWNLPAFVQCYSGPVVAFHLLRQMSSSQHQSRNARPQIKVLEPITFQSKPWIKLVWFILICRRSLFLII